ncbi:hypothetical protein VTJ04DRAFT_8023 [Mycothermus thermophilus]|uniref:uncharacterized protein n=1 Tax=Humicola insolens TaxID=85995 RepID=UPI0037429564
MLRPSHLRAILLPLRLTEPLHTVHHHGVPLRPTTVVSQWQQQQRSFHRSPAMAKKQMPPRPKPPPENEIEESFIKGSGPGGQKINKTSSAVQLKHLPTGLVVKCQATRSRSQNRKIARELLALKLEQLEKGDQSRAAIVAETKRKRAASKIKKSRRKYRQLEEEEKEKEAQEEAGKKKNSGLPAGLDPVVLAAMTGMGHIVVPNVAAAVSATATTTAATRPVGGGGGGTAGQSGRNDVDDEEEDDEEEWEEEEEEEYEEEDEEEWEEEEAEEEDEYDELDEDSGSNPQNNTKTKPPGKKAQR